MLTGTAVKNFGVRTLVRTLVIRTVAFGTAWPKHLHRTTTRCLSKSPVLALLKSKYQIP